MARDRLRFAIPGFGFLIMVFAVVAMPVLLSAADPTVSFTSLEFFEGGTPRPKDPQFSRIFSQSSARYIYNRIKVKNHKHGIGGNPVEFRFRFYDEDDTFKGEATVNYELPSIWESSYLYAGWGWSSPGNWESGEYRVEAYYFDADADYNDFKEGYKLFRTQFFKIAPDPSTATLAPDPKYSIYRIRNYESDLKTTDDRDYKDTFKVSETRSVWTELGMINHQYPDSGFSYSIGMHYYRSDGTRFGNANNSYDVPKEWKTVRVTNGLGWNQPGNWKPGDYEVRIVDSGRLLRTHPFTVIEDRPISTDYSVHNIRFYEAGPASTNFIFKTEFSPDQAHYIYTEFSVVNPNHTVRSHTAEFTVSYIRYRGRDEEILTRNAVSRTFSPDEDEVLLDTAHGWKSPGLWEPGRYGVEITMDDRLLNMSYFRVERPHTGTD